MHACPLTHCSNRVPGISAVPHEDNLRYFDVTVHGPSQSPYEGTYSRKLDVVGQTCANLQGPVVFCK